MLLTNVMSFMLGVCAGGAESSNTDLGDGDTNQRAINRFGTSTRVRMSLGPGIVIDPS